MNVDKKNDSGKHQWFIWHVRSKVTPNLHTHINCLQNFHIVFNTHGWWVYRSKSLLLVFFFFFEFCSYSFSLIHTCFKIIHENKQTNTLHLCMGTHKHTHTHISPIYFSFRLFASHLSIYNIYFILFVEALSNSI